MSLEGNDTINQEVNLDVRAEDTLHGEDAMNHEILAAYAEAEEGMTPIPDTVEVEDAATLEQLVGMSSDLLERYRVDNLGE